MSDARSQQRDSEVGELHRSIGEFVTSFEEVCFTVHGGIVSLLQSAGLRNQRLADVILAGMTAEPLTSLYAAIVPETQKLEVEDRKVVNNTLKRFRDLTAVRNDIVHRMCFVGGGNDQTSNWSSANRIKVHINTSGPIYKVASRGPVELREHVSEAIELVVLFNCFMACFIENRPISNFVDVSTDGAASVLQKHRGATWTVPGKTK